MDFMCLLICLFFAGFCLLCGYFEYRERKGYNMPEEKKYNCCDNGNFDDGHECQKQPGPIWSEEDKRNNIREFNEMIERIGMPAHEREYYDLLEEHGGWYPIYVLGKWPQTKWIYKHPGD